MAASAGRVMSPAAVTALTARPDIPEQTAVMVRPSGAIDVLFQLPEGGCATAQAALEMLDRSGIAAAFVAPCRQWSCERQWMCLDRGLDDVLRLVRESARLVGLAGYNPYDIAASLRQIERAARLGFRGVYFRPESFSIAATDARVYPLLGKAAEVGLPLVMEAGTAELAPWLERTATDFPELGLALAPALQPASAGDAASGGTASELPALLERHEKLAFVLDATALAELNRGQRQLLEDAAFVARCMWASNGAEPISALDGVAALQLAPALLQDLLRGTASRFFSALHGPESGANADRGLAPDEVTVAER